MEVVVTTGAISRANLQSNHHHQQTTIQFFTGRMPFLSPNKQRQSTEGKISHSIDLLTGAIRRTKLQSNCRQQQTNTQHFALLVTQSTESTDGLEEMSYMPTDVL